MKTSIRAKNPVAFMALISVGAVTLAVALPQFFHLLGGWLGVQTALGEMLLPMHLPVMLAGLWGGPVAGLLAGLVSPIISFGLTNMPVAAMVPFMTVELAGYGLTAGLLSRHKMPVLGKVLLTQVAGRVARAVVLLVAVYGFDVSKPAVSIIWTSISAGLAGILLQWALIPLLVRRKPQ